MATVAATYARAFADATFASKADAAALARQLNDVLVMLGESGELREVWENPAVPAEQKHAVLNAITAKAGLGKLLRNFMAVVIDHRRVLQLSEIAARFEEEVNQRLGLAEAEITSARELSAEERRQIEAQIGAATGKTIRAGYKVDPQVLGGAVARVGSTVYDGSVRGQLRRLKEELAG